MYTGPKKCVDTPFHPIIFNTRNSRYIEFQHQQSKNDPASGSESIAKICERRYGERRRCNMTDLRDDEKHVVDELEQLPYVKDHRSKEEVYRKISSGFETQKRTGSNKRKRKTVIIPVIASAVALILLVVLLPSIFSNGMQQTSEHQKNGAADEPA